MKKIIITITLLVLLVGSAFAGSDKVFIVNNTDRAVKVKVESTAYERYGISIIGSTPHSEIELSAFEDREYLFEEDREDTTIQFSEKGWYILRRYKKHDDVYIEIWYSDESKDVWYDNNEGNNF